MTDSPFPPFMPLQASPPTQPEQLKAEKTAKKLRSARVPADQKPQVELATPPAKPPRKPRGLNKLKAHAPKFDLQTTLAAAQALNEADFPMFEKMVLMLDEAGKPARDRLLAAIGKVFG